MTVALNTFHTSDAGASHASFLISQPCPQIDTEAQRNEEP